MPIDVGKQEFTRLLSHDERLVGDGRQAGGGVSCMYVVAETYQRDIFRNSQPLLFDSVEGGKEQDVVERNDSVGTVGKLQQLGRVFHRNFEVNRVTHHEFTVYGNAVVMQGLNITMLTASNHIQMVRATDECDTSAACIDEVLGCLLGCLVTIGCDAAEGSGIQVRPKNTSGIPISLSSSK